MGASLRAAAAALSAPAWRCALTNGLLGLAGWVGLGLLVSGPKAPETLGADATAPRAAASAAEAHEIELAGLWSRYDGQSEGERLRFWYFHGDGKGLYRYGRVGYANTHSFDYQLVDERLELRFRKTGVRHELAVRTGVEGGRRWMELEGDPREPGARYHWRRGPLGAAERSPDLAATEAAASPRLPGGRVWIDFRSYATGGAGFAMYQLEPAAVDGRGVGWFHEGDFDQWRTEALSYRIDGDALELWFDLNEELGVTAFRIEGSGDARVLVLDEDPRDFWLRHRYRDGGAGFSQPAFFAVEALARASTVDAAGD